MSEEYELEVFWRPIANAYCRCQTAQPPYMGLAPSGFDRVYQRLATLGLIVSLPKHKTPQRETHQLLFSMREEEYSQLVDLLECYVDQATCYHREAVMVIATTCLGSNHLWSDLGLPDRKALNEMIRFYFPVLHAKNHNNMRWKRFFYRQLCESGGDYVCRSPSCEECSSYDECFEPEREGAL